MSAGAPPGSGSLLSATDFFGKTDVGGLDKFKTIAFRALHEQKLEEELQQTKQENERLKDAHTRVTRDLEDLQVSFAANIEDRERVLAFKSKRIDELHNKLREYETINASLLQTINGGVEGDTSASQSIAIPTTNATTEPVGTEPETRARMMTLINAGKPLFHALDTCKEQEYKQLFEDSQRHCEQLTQTALENEAAMRETRLVKFNKQDSDIQIEQLQAQLATMALEKDQLEHHLERKLILENDRLRREKEAELQAFHDAMRTQMRMQLDVTTQRTVEENERVQLELRYQSSQLEKMMKQSDELRAENKRTKHEMHVFEEMNAGLSKKLKFYEQLFAKMQQKDERSRQVDGQPRTAKTPVDPPTSRRIPRKPPLPALSTVNCAKPTSSEASSMDIMGSPRGSYFSPDVDRIQTGKYPEFESDPNDPQTPYQLNAVTDVLEKHLQSREFTKKQVVAVLRYHHDQYQRRESPRVVRDTARLGTTPVFKKKLMLAKACYLPSSYGRRIREPSMTLDTLIKQNLSFNNSENNSIVNDEQRQILHNLLLPELSKEKRKDKPASSYTFGRDPSEMWKTSASRPHGQLQHHDLPATARF
ncbi:hypothetical protein GN958_ATG14971 [Phytophthora infestans]|uniref:Cilia- and flagella-associated protein 157 n=1 Tax=Phytophthora infestans TaxID=4787 RepID=A0A8S9TXD2_PHYIN|nr:hypothetical protein GN958_ATG20260 [Phytophthora infestans]KAF4135838.1 hypothetical protein GN958_ATG14971 [Phytophthora infestans]